MPQCQAALSPPSAGLPGKLIFRAQASTIVHTPILLSLTVGLCSHQPGFLFPRPGPNSAGKSEVKKVLRTLVFFQHWAQHSLELFQPPVRTLCPTSGVPGSGTLLLLHPPLSLRNYHVPSSDLHDLLLSNN